MFQMDMSIAIGLICILALAYFYFPKLLLEKKRPALLISSLKPFEGRPKTLFEKFSFLPNWLILIGMISFLIALMDPHLLLYDSKNSDIPPDEGLALYLLLDRSGSMQTIIDQEFVNGHWAPISRFSKLQVAANGLIQAMPQDLIGVIAFARSAVVISPLTLDHKLLEKKINQLHVIKDPDQDGTSIGYAIYKTAHLIAASAAFSHEEERSAPYKILSAFMIVITDGFQDPNLLDKGDRLRSMELEESAKYAKEKNIKIYIVNIDASFMQEKFAPNRHEMERISESTGGKFFLLKNSEELIETLNLIPKREKSQIYSKGANQSVRFSFYPYLISFGLISIALGLFMKETLFRNAL